MRPVFPTTRPDAFEQLRSREPAAVAALEQAGYGFAGEDVYGRCHGVATLFLELNPSAGLARGWVFDMTKNQFVGSTFEVSGPLERALAKARDLIESVYSEDQLSGTAERLTAQRIEKLNVD